VAEVASQEEALARFGYRHDHGIGEIQADVFVPVEHLERAKVLCVPRSVERVRAVEKGVPEHQRGPCVPSGTEDEMDFDIDRPRNDDPPPEALHFTTLPGLASRGRAGRACRRPRARECSGRAAAVPPTERSAGRSPRSGRPAGSGQPRTTTASELEGWT